MCHKHLPCTVSLCLPSEFSDSGSSSSDMSEYESDGDMEDSLSPSSPHKRLVDLADTPLQLQEYMDLMDRQLAQTTIGESFVRQPPQSAASRDKVNPPPPLASFTVGSSGRAVERRTVHRGDGGSIPPTPVSKLRQFRSPHICLCLSEETLKAGGPVYLVSMPGEIKDPTRGVNV